MCEGGDVEFTDQSQDCYVGSTQGDPYFDLDIARLRFFGGSTNHWGGWCRTFEENDFDRSDISEDLVWPIRKADLDPYLAEACDILDISPDFRDGAPNPVGIRPIGFNFSPPTYFSEKYLAELEDSENIALVLNANLIDVTVKNNRISHAEFLSFGRNSLKVKANTFVFAMGGIENSRMLKWLHSIHGDALHDRRLPVGNYWMEHPTFELGEAVVETEVADQRYFSTATEFQEKNGILNCGLIIDGVSRKQTSKLINELLCIAPALGRKLMEMADRRLVCGGKIKSAWEQRPIRSNRIELSKSAVDTFGIPRPVLHWKKTDFDRKTVLTSLQLFNNWLMDSDLGRLKLYDWLVTGDHFPTDDTMAGHHHMGGTRMGVDPEISVVDSDCRVFGTENLYIAGSSVFTSAGHNNPTLPIVQFTLRLAEHLVEN